MGPEQFLNRKAWCKTVLQDAIANFSGNPEIVNSRIQGTQYTSALWTRYLEEQKNPDIHGRRKGRATDNTIWIERFWKSVKYDYVYLNPAPEDGFELYQGIEEYMVYYNEKIHHTIRQSPNERYQNPIQKAA